VKIVAFVSLFVIAAFTFCAFPIRGDAELIFQTAKSLRDTEWRRAGSSLFTGIARIYDGLAAFEGKNDDTGKRYMHDAIENVTLAADTYKKLGESIENPRKIDLSRFPEIARRFSDVFREYGLAMPEDERQAAKLAEVEVMRFLQALKTAAMKLESSARLEGAQDLQRAVCRLGGVGTEVAGLMQFSL
jgi:hypothetical protein